MKHLVHIYGEKTYTILLFRLLYLDIKSAIMIVDREGEGEIKNKLEIKMARTFYLLIA